MHDLQNNYCHLYTCGSQTFKLTYCELHTRKLATLILVHGGPGNSHVQLLELARKLTKFHAVVYDQRGCGRSAPQRCCAENTINNQIEDIEMLRQALNLNKISILGFSFGAEIALRYAMKYGIFVDHVFLVSGWLCSRQSLNFFYGNAQIFLASLWKQLVDKIKSFIAERNSATLFETESIIEHNYDLSQLLNEDTCLDLVRNLNNYIQTEFSFAQITELAKLYTHIELCLADGVEYTLGSDIDDEQLNTFVLELHYFNKYIVQSANPIDFEQLRNVKITSIHARDDLIASYSYINGLLGSYPNFKSVVLEGCNHNLLTQNLITQLVMYIEATLQ